MTFIKKFESIKKKFDGLDASTVENKIAMQVNMVDEDCGGAFYVEAENGVLNVEPYDYNDHTVMLTLKAADIIALVGKKATLDSLTESGDVTVEGNYAHALAIFDLKKKPVKRAPKTDKKAETPAKAEKKPAAQKTTAKAADKAEKPEKKTTKTTKK